MSIKIFTIGFTKKTAEQFFTLLRSASIKKVVDVRLNPSSQLSAFSRRDDLRYFLKSLDGMDIDYVHELDLAPTKDMLDSYRKDHKKWEIYKQDFMNLLEDRRIESIDKELVSDGCLLCSEDKPHFCHRSLVAEYLKREWGDVEVQDL